MGNVLAGAQHESAGPGAGRSEECLGHVLSNDARESQLKMLIIAFKIKFLFRTI